MSKYESLCRDEGYLYCDEAILRSGKGLFAAAKVDSLLRTRKFGPSLVAAKRASPRRTRRLAEKLFLSTAVKQTSPRWTKRWDIVFLPSFFKIHQCIKNKHM